MHIAFISQTGFIDDFTTDKPFKQYFKKLPQRNHGKNINPTHSYRALPAQYFAGYYNQILYFFNTARNNFVTRQASKVGKVKVSQILQKQGSLFKAQVIYPVKKNSGT